MGEITPMGRFSFRVYLGSLYHYIEKMLTEVELCMNYIIADPDTQNGIELKKILDEYKMLDCQGSFATLKTAKKNIGQNPPDIAFIFLGKTELNAFRLAGLIKEQNPFSKIIFMSSQKEIAVEAFEYEADGFLLIPFDKRSVGKLVRSIGTVKMNTRKF
jgi:two-component system response regulator AlgR